MPLTNDYTEAAPIRTQTNSVFWLAVGWILLLVFFAFNLGPSRMTPFLDPDVANGQESTQPDRNGHTALDADELNNLRREVAGLKGVIEDVNTDVRLLKANGELIARSNLNNELASITREFDQKIAGLEAQLEDRGDLLPTGYREDFDAYQGKLIIDNVSGRKTIITVNGRAEELLRGRNSYSVEIGDVRVTGDGRMWLLDESLWDGSILYRSSWPL